MKNLILTLLIASSGLFACKTQSGAMGADRTTPADSGKTTIENNDEVYDMIISFISKGAGTDRELKPKIDQIIEDFSAKNNVSLDFEKVGWGREGEVDYNFMFKNLSTAQKKDFIAQIKAAVGSSDMVFVAFNKKSVHKR